MPGCEGYGEFLRYDLDAVVIAARFRLHAQFAKRALMAGKHVLPETGCNVMLAEGVELYRLAEEADLC